MEISVILFTGEGVGWERHIFCGSGGFGLRSSES